MNTIVLFDDKETRDNLLPLTLTRPVAEIRVGIETISRKWALSLDTENVYYITEPYLSNKYHHLTDGNETLIIAGHIFPNKNLVDSIKSLRLGEALTADQKVIAYRGTTGDFLKKNFVNKIEIENAYVDGIYMLYDIFMKNGDQITADFSDATSPTPGKCLSESCKLIGPAERLYIHPTAKVEGAILNTSTGEIFIGPNAEVMEGSCLRGPIALCHNATINMGTKVYPATTIGPWSKVGGELNNVVIIGYSNKAHDGFLGNAVIGEWCNLGAGCVASNLKNDYTKIKLWNYPAHRFLKTDLQFCGLIMGDHSKAGINTMFNTATVVGVGVNIHGSGFPRNFIPSFSEGSTAGFSDVSMTKFFQIASRVMARRHVELTKTDETIFYAIRDFADNYK